MNPEQQLINRLKARDLAAFDDLFDRYAASLHGLIRQILPPGEDTAATLADAFRNIVQHIDNYDPQKSLLFTWLLQETRKTAIQKLKSLQSRKFISASQALAEPAAPSNLVYRLDKEQQELVRLSFFKGYSVEDVADLLNITVETARLKTRSALARLNMLL